MIYMQPLFIKMSCDLRKVLLEGLLANSEGKIRKAKANVEVYLHNPAGIGEHPDVLEAIRDQLVVIAHEEELMDVIERHFTNHEHA